MFEDKTYDSILSEMLSRIPDTYDKREGSVIWDALSPAAIELQNAYLAFDEMLNETFGDTASREYLIRLAKERGITPYAASKAVLKGSFTPSSVEIEVGARFNCSNSSYVVISHTDDVYRLACEEAGVIGNRYLGQIIPVDYIEGLETAALTEVLIPGEDEEDTESLRARYMDSFNEKAFSGNAADYRAKTLAISGVGAVKIEPVWDGAGTVRLTILDSDFNPASSALVDEVQTAFDPEGDGKGDGLAPIGHVVTVRSAGEVDVSITMTISFDSGYSWQTHQTLIENAIKAYLSELRHVWSDNETLIVRISQLETRVLSIEGILDVNSTKINGSASNLTVAAYNVPMFEGVSEE